LEHIGGLHILAYPHNIDQSLETTLKDPGVLAVDIIHPVNFYTRRINCTEFSLNEWKERNDFTSNKLGSTYTRYLMCGSLDKICKTVAILQRLRPRLIYKTMKGLDDVAEVNVTQFGPNHCPPITDSDNKDEEPISPEMLAMLQKNKFIDPKHLHEDYPLEGIDGCFQDYIDRVRDVPIVEESLNRILLDFSPPCKVKEYMHDHRGLNGSKEYTYYSFCKGRVLGDDFYHCKTCGLCVDRNHWHQYSKKVEAAKGETKPSSHPILLPLPLSGRLAAPHSGRAHSFHHESGNASGIDDMDEPTWPEPDCEVDQMEVVDQCDWTDLLN